jgi:triosephosphate isomerase
MTRVTVGVSFKAYFGREQARTWFGQVADRVRDHDALDAAQVDVFVVPSYLQIHDAIDAFADTRVAVGAQDVAAYPPGAFTGEVTAAELAEIGVAYAEVGHAERRRLFRETDDHVAAKVTASLAAGVTPVICVGETERMDAAEAAAATVRQLRATLAGAGEGRVVAAYEPVWAIGAPEPAPATHIATVTRALRTALADGPGRGGSAVIYGGSAGPGLLTALGDDVDGLFLGRFAHDPDAFLAVLDEASTLSSRRRAA